MSQFDIRFKCAFFGFLKEKISGDKVAKVDKGKPSAAGSHPWHHLTPLVGLLAQCLKSHPGEINSLALRVLTYLVKFRLGETERYLDEFVRRTFSILHSYSSLSSSLAQHCLKLLSTIMDDCKTFKLSETQIKFLLTKCYTNMEEVQSRVSIFAVLKSVLAQGRNMAELVPIMKRVSELLVQSTDPSVQGLCSQV